MKWQIPNQLTVGRIALAAVFFVLLGFYEHQTVTGTWLLNAAFAIYIVAGITDVLDGYLARRWNQTSAFGRIADPFVDKILVVGAFAMLTGMNFAYPDAGAQVGQVVGRVSEFERNLPHWLTGGMASCVQAWMVVVIMGREFVVSAVRGYSESQGIKFPATYAGKIKMFVQSVAICTVLCQLANVYSAPWAVIMKVVVVWLAVIATVLSGLGYVRQTVKLFRQSD